MLACGTDHVAAGVEATCVPQQQHVGGGVDPGLFPAKRPERRRRRRRDEGHRVLDREKPGQQQNHKEPVQYI